MYCRKIVAFLVILCASQGVAIAQQKLNLANLPNFVEVFDETFVARNGILGSNRYTGIWLCEGDNAKTGSCATASAKGPARLGKSEIKLEFTHQSGLKREIILYATRAASIANRTRVDPQPIDQSLTAGNRHSEHVRLEVWIDRAELERFTPAGRWSANLILRHDEFLGLKRYPQYDVDLKINYDIVDPRNAGLYFYDPESGAQAQRDATISVPLTSPVGKSTYQGEKKIKMCLYDGNDGSSAQYSITASQSESTGSSKYGTAFVLRHASDDSEIPLNMELTYRGSSHPVLKGKENLLGLTPASDLTSVRIPGVSSPVKCAPAGLNIRIPPIDVLKSRAGEYRSTIQLNFGASALSP